MTVDSARIATAMAPVQRAVRNDFVRHGALVFLASMLVNVANYGIHFTLSRKLGIADYASLAALLNVLTIVTIPSAIGAMIIVKFVAEFHAQDDLARIRLLLERVLLIAAGLAGSLFVLAIAFRGAIAAYLNMSDSRPVIAAAVVMILSLIVPLVRALLQGTQDFARFSVSTVLEAVGRLGLSVAFVWFGLKLTGAFTGSALASAAALGYTLYAVRPHWRHARSRVSFDVRRVVLTTGGVVATTICLTVMGFIDVPLVKHFFTPSQAGTYSAVSVCGKMLFFLVGFIPTVVLPKATAGAARRISVKPIVLQALCATIMLSGAALLAFYFFPKVIIGITYGSKFMGAAPYIFSYGLAMTFLAGTGVVTTYKIGMHRFGFVVPLAIIALGEVLAIHLLHGTLWNIVMILLAGHTLAFAVCCTRFLEHRHAAR